MVQRFRRNVTIVVAAVAALLLAATAAFAQYPTPPDFGLSCTPEEPVAGDEVTCTVVGAVPGEVLAWAAAIDGAIFADGSVTASDAEDETFGTATFGFAVPADAAAGAEVAVTVSGDESGETSTVLGVAAEMVEEDEEAVEELPTTGADASTLLLGGAGILGLGLLVALVTRSRASDRRRSDVSA